MSYMPQWRTIYSDVNVSHWADLCDDPSDSAEKAYGKICEYIHGVPNRVGFTDAPEYGKIRTGRGYADASLFEDPRFTRQQYRIVWQDTPVEVHEQTPLSGRAIYLD
jgi:hypothetical protein